MRQSTLAELLADLLSVDPTKIDRNEFRRVLGYTETPIGMLSPADYAIVCCLRDAKYVALCVACQKRVLIGEETTSEALRDIHLRRPRYLVHMKCSGRRHLVSLCSSPCRAENLEDLELRQYQGELAMKFDHRNRLDSFPSDWEP